MKFFKITNAVVRVHLKLAKRKKETERERERALETIINSE